MSKSMKLELQKARENTLKKLNIIRSCGLARNLCMVIRVHRAVLTVEDINKWCSFVSGLCKTVPNCTEQAELCRRAAEAVLKDEQKYLDICMESCKKCGQFRPNNARSIYVA